MSDSHCTPTQSQSQVLKVEEPATGFSKVFQSMQGLASHLQRLTAGEQRAQGAAVSDLSREIQGLQRDLAEATRPFQYQVLKGSTQEAALD
eukprot:s734_g4.t1